MAKVSPRGLGVFIAFRERIGTAAQAAALAVSIGAAWVAPRAGDYGNVNDAAFLAEPSKRSDPEARKAAIRAEIAAYHEAGLLVYPWLYSRPGCWRAEVEAFALLMECGADGVIIDAEIQWGAHAADAAAYMIALRERLGDAFIADAPWPWIAYHPEYPEKEFADGVDARMLQAYWTEINRDGAKADLDKTRSEWAARFATPGRTEAEQDPIWPIGVTYGRDELVAVGGPACPGVMSAADVLWFLDQYPGQPASLYSLEMLTAGTPASKELLAALRARAAALVVGTPEVAPGKVAIDAPITEALIES